MFLIKFLNARLKAKRERERYQQMVQNCVTRAVALKAEIDMIKKRAFSYEDKEKYVMRRIRRRLRALNRIARIQEAAWRLGFKTEPPIILQNAVAQGHLENIWEFRK